MNSIVNTQIITTSTTAVELNAEAQVALAKFAQAKEAIKALEAQKDEAEAILREALGTAEVGLVNGKNAVKVAQRTRKGTDAKVLAEKFPEAYEATLVATSYSFLQNL
jgi:predicted phage-related endonuclease